MGEDDYMNRDYGLIDPNGLVSTMMEMAFERESGVPAAFMRKLAVAAQDHELVLMPILDSKCKIAYLRFLMIDGHLNGFQVTTEDLYEKLRGKNDDYIDQLMAAILNALVAGQHNCQPGDSNIPMFRYNIDLDQPW